jgi:hypothetical protein
MTLTNDERRALGDEIPTFLADPRSSLGKSQLAMVKVALQEANENQDEDPLGNRQLHVLALAAHQALRNGW